MYPRIRQPPVFTSHFVLIGALTTWPALHEPRPYLTPMGILMGRDLSVLSGNNEITKQ